MSSYVHSLRYLISVIEDIANIRNDQLFSVSSTAEGMQRRLNENKKLTRLDKQVDSSPEISATGVFFASIFRVEQVDMNFEEDKYAQ